MKQFKQLTPGKLRAHSGPAVGQNPAPKTKPGEFYLAKAPGLGKAYGDTKESAVLALCLPNGEPNPEIKNQYGSDFVRWDGRKWEEHEVRARARFLPNGEFMDYSTASSIEKIASMHASEFGQEGEIEVTRDGSDETYHVVVYSETTYVVDSVRKTQE